MQELESYVPSTTYQKRANDMRKEDGVGCQRFIRFNA
jgi:hypothetical protein